MEKPRTRAEAEEAGFQYLELLPEDLRMEVKGFLAATLLIAAPERHRNKEEQIKLLQTVLAGLTHDDPRRTSAVLFHTEMLKDFVSDLPLEAPHGSD